MSDRRAIVSGASIAGLSAAFWLRRTGWQVTVLERAPAFREGGQNVDVRGVAHEVLERMGLVEALRALNTTETGTVIVGGDGEVVAELPSDGPDGATAELEVLRGDFAKAIFEALPDGVDLHYGETITSVGDDADDNDDVVRVATGSGLALEAELLVIAEGVRSSTRDLLLAAETELRPLGITMAFGTIPRTTDDDTRWRWFNAPGGRQVHLRPDDHGTTRAMLAYATDDGDLPDVIALRERFADAGWVAPRVLDGFDTSEDVYVDALTQVRMTTWHRGRVCVTGDAAWCVTPLGGGGASLALTGGYVLAASLSTAADTASALAAFETWMRPLVDDVQGLPPGIRRLAYPQSALGVRVQRLAVRAMTSAPLAAVASRVTQVADDERELPEMRTAH